MNSCPLRCDHNVEVASHQRLHRWWTRSEKISAADKPCFSKNPLSCATHSGACDALIAAQATRASLRRLHGTRGVFLARRRFSFRYISIANSCPFRIDSARIDKPSFSAVDNAASRTSISSSICTDASSRSVALAIAPPRLF